jgi:ABC-type antimicrobial peptide transport system permease subunit
VYDASLDLAPTPTIYKLFDDGTEVIASVRFVVAGLQLTSASQTAVRHAVHAIGPDSTVTKIDTIGDRLIDSVRARVFTALVLGLFGMVGTIVTVAGLASVVAFLIARRTREIAIRIALGADPARVRRLVTQEALGAALVGGAVGLIVGQITAGSLHSLVYGLVAGNWTTSLIAAISITLVEAFTALVMAHRALTLRPSEALKVE